MELGKIVLFLTGLVSINLAGACMQQVNFPSHFRVVEETDKQLTKAVRPVLRSLFNLGDLDAEKFSYHIESREEKVSVIIHLSNLSPEEVVTLQKKIDESSMLLKSVIYSTVVGNAIRKLLDLVVINGRELKEQEWYFNGAINPTTEKRSYVLAIGVKLRRMQSSNGFFELDGLIMVLKRPLRFDGPAYNSIKVDGPVDRRILRIE